MCSWTIYRSVERYLEAIGELKSNKWYENDPGTLTTRLQVWKWKCSCLVVSDFCDPVDCSPPGSSVLGILQARILEWVSIPFSRGSSWPRDQTRISCIAGRFFTEPPGKPRVVGPQILWPHEEEISSKSSRANLPVPGGSPEGPPSPAWSPAPSPRE